MTLDIALHRTILFQILKDIYTEPKLASFLGFKGGTMAMMFYGLDRFSVDLDFDLLQPEKADLVFSEISLMLKKYGVIKDAYHKRYNLFWLLSYESKAHNIKIEINKRNMGSRYEIKSYLGVPMQVMVAADMVAHKLVALDERIDKTSRDLYDAWFFLKKRLPINPNIIKARTGLDFNPFIDRLVDKVTNLSDKRVLVGMGELLTDSQKDWARAKLKEETVALLKLRKA